MDESELQEYRRQRLREWLRVNGGPKAACTRLGLKKSTESYISQLLGGETFGHKAARNMESKLGMESGYLDDRGQQAGATLSPLAMSLALMYDGITANMSLRDSTIVYQAAQAAITKPLVRPDALPSDTPAPPGSPRKQRV